MTDLWNQVFDAGEGYYVLSPGNAIQIVSEWGLISEVYN